MNDSKIAALVKANENIEASLITEAAEKNAKQARERQVALLQSALVTVDATTQQHVATLRNARKVEAKAKENLSRVADAAEAFKKGGDVEAYAKEVWPTAAEEYNRNDFVRRFQAIASGN
jgi:hypothetical protein